MNSSDIRLMNVSRETSERLQIFADLLVRWNPRINLIAPSDIPDLWQRHIHDSLQLADQAPGDARSWLDLGSGGGFPGLICAAALQESQPAPAFTLVESDHRKAAFLREAARAMNLPVNVVSSRIEGAGLPVADVISARALAPLPKLLDYCAPYCHDGTCLLFLKGRRAESELTHCATDWKMAVERIPSSTDSDGVILKIRSLGRRP